MTVETINYRFKVRGGTAANLATVNEIPLARELVFETDTGKSKLGDGVTHWLDLDYIEAGSGPGGGSVSSLVPIANGDVDAPASIYFEGEHVFVEHDLTSSKHHQISGKSAVHQPWFVGPTDPALDPANEVTAFKGWYDTAEERLKFRNSSNTEWRYVGAGGGSE